MRHDVSVYRKWWLQERDRDVDGAGPRPLLGAIALGALVLLLAGLVTAAAEDPGDVSIPAPAPAEERSGHTEVETSPPAEPATVDTLVYTPGRGLRFGATGITLGGYASANLSRNEGDRARLQIDDLSVFVVADPRPHLHFFSEVEVEDSWVIDDHGETVATSDRFTVERLFADVALADSLTIRAGVFLTPVGRWNVIHAAPLVWTTSRPLTTEVPFDTRSTGIMAFGTLFPADGVLTYSLFGQVIDPIEGNPGFEPANESVGGRLEYTARNGWSVGGTYLAADRDGGWRHLADLDSLWNLDPLELMSEFVYDDGPSGPAQWGGYLQAALRIAPKVYMVERYEHFSPRTAIPDVNLIASGLAYKPRPNMILKSEYLAADRSGADVGAGFKVSFAILF